MPEQLHEFQKYQLAFTAHLRDPHGKPLPTGIAHERMAVYQEIVFNTLFESINACFPVTRQIVARQITDQQIWPRLVQAFMQEYAAHSPLFRKIPEQFLHYLKDANPALLAQLPPYTYQLCHYEWIELHVASSSEAALSDILNRSGDLAESTPVLTSTLQLLHYDYPVHRISPDNTPEKPQSTQLLVYLDAQDTVKFIELNPLTFQLLTLLKHKALNGKQALTLLAEEIPHLDPQQVMEFGLQTLQMLRQQGVIIGTVE